MWSKISKHKRTDTEWLYLYEASKIVRLIEEENIVLVVMDWGMGEMGSSCSTGITFVTLNEWILEIGCEIYSL